MQIEFDPAKDAINRERHGVPLALGAAIFDDADHLVIATVRPEDGEERYKVVGLVNGRLHTAVHVMRGEAVRFISVRRSNAGEERAYHGH